MAQNATASAADASTSGLRLCVGALTSRAHCKRRPPLRGGRSAPHAQASLALTVISETEANAFEIGQFALVKATFSSKRALSNPGTTAETSRSILVMVGPSPSVTVALVSMLVGGFPAAVSCADRNMEKHPAWAAPTSSSGFVPPL